MNSNVLHFYTVDSFAKKVFSGNPAGVCILQSAAGSAWMQNVAMEMNLSETAFLFEQAGKYHLRWFTPESEVALCGHATLAPAHILWELELVKTDKSIVFATQKRGDLVARQEAGQIVLDFPSRNTKEMPAPKSLDSILGAESSFVGLTEENDWLVEVGNAKILRAIKPDLQLLSGLNCRGVIVTAKGDEKYDFVSRFFAPEVGVWEDPVTGSAHCALAPYWGARLGKTSMLGYQASKRGGEVGVELKNDRVLLKGSAITVFKLEMINAGESKC